MELQWQLSDIRIKKKNVSTQTCLGGRGWRFSAQYRRTCYIKPESDEMPWVITRESASVGAVLPNGKGGIMMELLEYNILPRSEVLMCTFGKSSQQLFYFVFHSFINWGPGTGSWKVSDTWVTVLCANIVFIHKQIRVRPGQKMEEKKTCVADYLYCIFTCLFNHEHMHTSRYQFTSLSLLQTSKT